MPTIRIDMFEGRTADQKRALVTSITQACVQSLGVSADSVDIVLFEVAKQNWASGGVLWSEKAAAPKPAG